MNITKATQDAHWAALMAWAVSGIPAKKNSRVYTLQELADACFGRGWFPWLLDGEEIVDVLITKHLKLTQKSEISLRVFLLGKTEFGAGDAVTFAEIEVGRYKVEAKPVPAVPMASGTEAEVCADITRRQAHGLAKYGVTVAANPLSLREWLQHAYEETLDEAIYLKRAMAEIDAGAGSLPAAKVA